MNIKFLEEKDNQDDVDAAQEYSQKSWPCVQIEMKINGLPLHSIITKWLK